MKDTVVKASTAPSKADEAIVIASRKSCSADGVGLSHYILMDKKASK